MRNNPKGEWVRDGPKEESVTEESATLGCENEHRIAVNEDRRNMARITENSRHLHSLIAAMQRCLKRPDASTDPSESHSSITTSVSEPDDPTAYSSGCRRSIGYQQPTSPENRGASNDSQGTRIPQMIQNRSPKSDGEQHCTSPDLTKNPRDDWHSFLHNDLCTPRLDNMYKHLWFAGRLRNIKPFHRQVMRGRTILLTEQVDMDMLWLKDCMFLKPLPPYLLDQQVLENLSLGVQAARLSAGNVTFLPIPYSLRVRLQDNEEEASDTSRLDMDALD
ncbi:MAG: hypothetical protein LQ340_002141 [Diploschistes diacapsis]|nr:MAG: hypothetical protein LQ340_002141 [Diploschistes diacapsis]